MPVIDDLLSAALAAELEARQARARADRLKGAVVAEAERVRRDVGKARSFTDGANHLGNLRLDGEGPAAPHVTDPAGFASWLAERAPSLVTATVTVSGHYLEEAIEVLNAIPDAAATVVLTVPATQLGEAIDVAEFAGIAREDIAAVVAPKAGASAWLTEHCMVIAEEVPEGTAPAWSVVHVTAGGNAPVDGVTASKPVPKWVLTPDKDRAAAAVTAGQHDGEEETGLIRGTVVPLDTVTAA
jgi:hypothetical protein